MRGRAGSVDWAGVGRLGRLSRARRAASGSKGKVFMAGERRGNAGGLAVLSKKCVDLDE